MDRKSFTMLNLIDQSRGEALSGSAAERARHQTLPGRLAISSIFGRPSDRATWSGAPRRIADKFGELGVEIVDAYPAVSLTEKSLSAIGYIRSGYGWLPSSLSLFRGADIRARRARRVASAMKRGKAGSVLHTGTLDLPAEDWREVDHFLYCDHTWNLWLRHRNKNDPHTLKARVEFDALDRKCYGQMRHIFTFGAYVRDDLIEHYGVEPDRVTAVGSGMGFIDPYFGPKNHDGGTLLFVAKHYFVPKGGELVLEAFRIARQKRPDLRLVIVWDGEDPRIAARYPEVEFRSHLSWDVLTGLYREACLLVEPAFNEPWGQVYLEALVSRTPVVGLNRNGLPEILERGRHGFLVDEATPETVANAILDAVSDPARLASMGTSGQRHVLRNYSWDGVVRAMAEVMSRPRDRE